MDEKQRYIRILLKKLDHLEKRQAEFQEEIKALRTEIEQLQGSEAISTETPKDEPQKETLHHIKQELQETMKPEQSSDAPPKKEKRVIVTPQNQKSSQPKPTPKKVKKPAGQSDFEKFIGENLANKIGIVITVLGVSLGIKYAIDNDIISPLMRIIMAYAFGGGLVGLAMYLKKDYKSFSAVLLSGAMAIFYFTTYVAYDFYAFIPQTGAFALMVIFTAFTVFASIHYDQPVISHIGLVGAYGVPFLLSDGSGRVAVLFTYMSIINLGILSIAVARYWKSLYYSAFILTWIIFLAWWGDNYDHEIHFKLAFSFAIVFFLIFYATLLSYKLVKKEKYSHLDVLLVLTNSFVFYGIGYALMLDVENGEKLLGVFTLANAMLHFIVAIIIFQQKLADRSLFYLIAGMVLIFVTIAIPVQLDGNWVTFLWAAEAALLFWIGRSQRVSIYEMLSYPLMVLAFISILHDWGTYKWGDDITPIFNIAFLTSVLFSANFVFINWYNHKTTSTLTERSKELTSTIKILAPAILVIVSYFTFYLEIANYFELKYIASKVEIFDADFQYHRGDSRVKDLRVVWLIIYTLGYTALFSFLNQYVLKKNSLGIINLVLNTVALWALLTAGLFTLGELRDSYLHPSEYFEASFSHVSVRYIAILFAAIVLFSIRGLFKSKLLPENGRVFYDLLIHLPVIWLLSNEIINWMQLQQAEHSYKLEITVLWGAYALFLVVLGIWQKQKHLRISAMILFGVTLAKLFLYDLQQMSAIGKVIVFVALGILLLIISFLYNKDKKKNE